jgi:hypothetical protein
MKESLGAIPGSPLTASPTVAAQWAAGPPCVERPVCVASEAAGIEAEVFSGRLTM